MANLIQLSSFSPIAVVPTPSTTASDVVVNVSNIISVKTLATPYETTGVTQVNYLLPVNNTSYVVELIVEETLAAVLAAANAPLA